MNEYKQNITDKFPCMEMIRNGMSRNGTCNLIDSESGTPLCPFKPLPLRKERRKKKQLPVFHAFTSRHQNKSYILPLCTTFNAIINAYLD